MLDDVAGSARRHLGAIDQQQRSRGMDDHGDLGDRLQHSRLAVAPLHPDDRAFAVEHRGKRGQIKQPLSIDRHHAGIAASANHCVMLDRRNQPPRRHRAPECDRQRLARPACQDRLAAPAIGSGDPRPRCLERRARRATLGMRRGRVCPAAHPRLHRGDRGRQHRRRRRVIEIEAGSGAVGQKRGGSVKIAKSRVMAI